MMPLAQVMAYNTEHLAEASAHWQKLADHREEVFATVHNEARTLPWEGLGADALRQRTAADYEAAMQSAGNLRAAAVIARDGAGTLTQMHSRVLYTVEDMDAEGFAPTEELGVLDAQPSTDPAVAAQRQAQAQAYAGHLKSQVADLYAHDAQVGADMGRTTAEEGKIQFVDHTFKQSPSGDPSQNAYDQLKDNIREHNSRYTSVTAETAPAYNQEADVLNGQKGELEAKLGKSETVPARMSRLVPDWAHPAPEQPHTPAPAQPRSPMDLSTPHAHDLGTDPAIGGRFRPNEAQTGLRIEQERGIDLIRNQQPGADWIDVATGDRYDGLGNFPARYFDEEWPTLQGRVVDHLNKAEYVPVDVSQFTSPQRAAVRAFVDGLKNPRVFIVGDN